MALPAWLAFRVQVPAAVKDTTPSDIEQIALLLASTVMATVKPDVDVAAGVYVAPPTVALGAGLVKSTVWDALFTVTVIAVDVAAL